MTNRTVRIKNFLATIARRKLRLLFGTLCARSFFAGGGPPSGSSPSPLKVSRIASQIRAGKENGESVNDDQPDRERLETDARLEVRAEWRRELLLHVSVLAVIHSLANAQCWIWSLLVHFGGAAGAGEADAAGADAGAADFTSLSGCD